MSKLVEYNARTKARTDFREEGSFIIPEINLLNPDSVAYNFYYIEEMEDIQDEGEQSV